MKNLEQELINSLNEENKKLQKKIAKLKEQLEYHKEQSRKFRKQRIEANKQIKLLQQQLNNSVPRQTGAKFQKTIELITKLQGLLKDTKQPHLLYQARLKQLNKLKESIGMPIYTACAFD